MCVWNCIWHALPVRITLSHTWAFLTRFSWKIDESASTFLRFSCWQKTLALLPCFQKLTKTNTYFNKHSKPLLEHIGLPYLSCITNWIPQLTNYMKTGVNVYLLTEIACNAKRHNFTSILTLLTYKMIFNLILNVQMFFKYLQEMVRLVDLCMNKLQNKGKYHKGLYGLICY